MNDWPEGRQRIAGALRALRKDAGLSTNDLATRLNWSQSRVSRLELGRTLAKPHEIEAWSVATGADPRLRGELVEVARQTANEFTEWRRELAPGRRRVQQEIQRLEENSSVTRVFSMDVIPGLAQTEPYVEAMFRLGREIGPVDEPTEEAVRARMDRQQVLEDHTKSFSLLMSEMALRRRLISQSAMRQQVEKLVWLDRQPNISIGVIPFDADERVHQYHAFAILGDLARDAESIALAESVTRAINIRGHDEVGLYVAHFEALWSEALEGMRVRDFLQGVIADLTDD